MTGRTYQKDSIQVFYIRSLIDLAEQTRFQLY